MITPLQRRLMAFIESHGFTPYPLPNGKVMFDIPCFRGESMKKFYETERVGNMSQARAALGY